MIVPRHPERFQAVAALIERSGLGCDTSPAAAAGSAREGTQVFLGDSMGELMLFYAAADVAFVGGSLVCASAGTIYSSRLRWVCPC